MGYENSGRRPQPTALKMLRGNPGKRRLSMNEPPAPTDPVEKPANLSTKAAAVWGRLAPRCIAEGSLTAAYVEPFATLCELQADLDMARAQKDAEGFAPFTLSEDYNGAPKVGVHGAIKLEKELAPLIRPFYQLFWMDSFSRAKASAPPKQAEEPASKWAGALK